MRAARLIPALLALGIALPTQAREALPPRADPLLGAGGVTAIPIPDESRCLALPGDMAPVPPPGADPVPVAETLANTPEAKPTEAEVPTPEEQTRQEVLEQLRDPEAYAHRYGEPAASPLEEAIRRARAAVRPASQRRAREQLERALRGPAPDDVRACGLLALARLELRSGRYPEAAAAAERAEAGLGARAVEARWVRAEASYLGSNGERAIPAYVHVLQQRDPVRAALARVRLVDVRFDQGPPRAAWPDYAAALERAAEQGIDVTPWRPRQVEAAIDARAFAEAAALIDDASDADPTWFAIRRADVAVAQGKRDEALERFEEVAVEHDATDLAVLARLRIYDWNLEAEAEARSVGALRDEIEKAESSALADYARVLLGQQLAAAGKIREALGLLVRQAYEPATPDVANLAQRSLDDALDLAAAEATSQAGCALLIQQLSDRQGTLLRRARAFGPFLTLGSCYEQFRLPEAALDLYRAMARHFGADVANAVSLPIARTSFAIGDIATARAAASLRIEREQGDPDWRRLLGASQLANGEANAAASLLGGVALDVTDPDLLKLLTRAVTLADDDPVSRGILRARLEDPAFADAPALGVTWLLAAHIHRDAGELEAAARLYARASEQLPEGPLEAEARYWIERLAPGTLERRAPDTSTFDTLIAERARLDGLRDRSGIGGGAPR